MSLASSQPPVLPLEYADKPWFSEAAWVRRLGIAIILVAAQSTLSRLVFLLGLSQPGTIVLPLWRHLYWFEFECVMVVNVMGVAAGVMALRTWVVKRTAMMAWALSSIVCSVAFLAAYFAAQILANPRTSVAHYPQALDVTSALGMTIGAIFLVSLPLIVIVFHMRREAPESIHPLYSTVSVLGVILLLYGAGGIAIAIVLTTANMNHRPILSLPAGYLAGRLVAVVICVLRLSAGIACTMRLAWARAILLGWVWCAIADATVVSCLRMIDLVIAAGLHPDGLSALRFTASMFTGLTLPVVVWMLFCRPDGREAFNRRG